MTPAPSDPASFAYLTLILSAAVAADDEVTDEDIAEYLAATVLETPIGKRTGAQRWRMALWACAFGRAMPHESERMREAGWGDAHPRECRAELEEQVRAWRVSRG